MVNAPFHLWPLLYFHFVAVLTPDWHLYIFFFTFPNTWAWLIKPCTFLTVTFPLLPLTEGQFSFMNNGLELGRHVWCSCSITVFVKLKCFFFQECKPDCHLYYYYYRYIYILRFFTYDLLFFSSLFLKWTNFLYRTLWKAFNWMSGRGEGYWFYLIGIYFTIRWSGNFNFF